MRYDAGSDAYLWCGKMLSIALYTSRVVSLCEHVLSRVEVVLGLWLKLDVFHACRFARPLLPHESSLCGLFLGHLPRLFHRRGLLRSLKLGRLLELFLLWVDKAYLFRNA